MNYENRIFKSSTFEGFEFYPENRPVVAAKVARLVAAIQKKNGLRENPLIIQRRKGKFWVLEGQHRYLAAKELKIPFWYIITEFETIADVAARNEQIDKWSLPNYVHYYSVRGNKHYIVLKKFIELYRFSVGDSIMMLTNKMMGGKAVKIFKQGTFEVYDYKLAVKVAEGAYDYKKYFEGWNRRYFLRAILYLFADPEMGYNHSIMMNKMRYRHGMLLYQMDIVSYLKNLQEIYNFRSRNKVRFSRE